ncbi:TolC family protein [bacterium]|nr:TolC family protein [bacterium]
MRSRISILVLLLILTASAFARTLTLEESIAVAVENNLELKMSQLDVDKAKWDLYKSYSSFVPTFKVTWSQMKQKLDIDPMTLAMFSSMPGGAAAMGLAEEINNIDLSFGIPIAVGGARYFAARLSAKALKLSKLQNRIQINTISFQTKINFFTLLFLKESIEIQKTAVEVAEEEYEIMVKKYENGEVPEPLLTAQRVTLRDEKNTLNKAKSDFRIAKEKFKRFLKIDEDIEVSGSFSEEFPSYSISELMEKLHSSQSIEAFESQIKILKDVRWLALTPALPSIFYSWNVNHKTDEFSWKSEDWYSKGVSMLIVDIPIFAQHGVYFERKKAKADIEKARLGLKAMKDQLETEIISSLMEIENVKDSYELLKLNHEMAQDNYDATKAAFESGEMSYTDLEKAQLLLNKTKLGFMGTLLQKEIAVAKIEYLTN